MKGKRGTIDEGNVIYVTLAMTGHRPQSRRVVIARSKATKQSSRRRPSPWIASLRSQ
ncbi:MAG: hypothetical protein LBT00_14880 [Spirochaetaceae bacterium]|nr:hypothetical protein [Spirochaetaceae bacterium]